MGMKSRRSDNGDLGEPSVGFQSRSFSVWTMNPHLEVLISMPMTLFFLNFINGLYRFDSWLTKCVGAPPFTPSCTHRQQKRTVQFDFRIS
ncbi:hypothetical protein MPLDJ20_10049 [Mesorhizobium plurifarium]|uniref:Uncharacterized protein n=1 Tax=Mesorhizobium plurifarium TaxID=69974 RepID=A0A090DBG3_MESPL|nr:hypothetical protein MPLDJ20_10049 [Mesorhizobium plurifarium]